MNKVYTILSILVICALVMVITVPFLGVVIGAVCALIIAHFTEGLESLGFRKPIIGFTKTVLLALAMAVVVQVSVYYVILPAIESMTKTSLRLPGFEALEGNLSAYLQFLVIGWLIGGLVEEILFRGFLLTRIQKLIGGKAGDVVAVLTTSFFFGYLHAYQGLNGQLLTGFLGLILGSFFVLNNKNIWLCILMHGFVNTVGFTLLFLGWYAP